MQGVEPTAGLIHAFGDKVGRATEIGSIDSPEAGLGIGHGAGVEPNVDKVGLALHALAARAHEEDVIHIRAMEVDLVVVRLRHVGRVEALRLKRILRHETGFHRLLYFVVKFFYGAYADLFPAVFGTPYGKWSSPIAAAAEIPVLDVLQPLSETAGTGRLRLPLDTFVELHHLLANGCSFNKPAVERVVKHGLIGTPAMRI